MLKKFIAVALLFLIARGILSRHTLSKRSNISTTVNQKVAESVLWCIIFRYFFSDSLALCQKPPY